MMKDFLKSMRSSRTAITSAFNVLDQLREEIAAKKLELEAVLNAPQPVEAALASYDQWAAAAANSAVDALFLNKLLTPATAREGLSLPVFHSNIDGKPVSHMTRAVEVLLGLLVATKPDAFRSIVEGQLADLTVGRECLDAETRDQRKALIEDQLLDLELCEEKAIREMGFAGVNVARRSSADPRAVLAADTSLPT